MITEHIVAVQEAHSALPTTSGRDSLLLRYEQIDRRLIAFMSRNAILLLRLSLSTTYLWFGALKVFGVSPAADLVAKTVPFLPKRFFVPFLGIWEMAIGVALLFRVALRPTLLLFAFQVAGTFLVLIARPRTAYQKKQNPLLLTMEGEFVIKNLVLLSAGLAVGSTAHRRDEEIHDERGQTDPEFRIAGAT